MFDIAGILITIFQFLIVLGVVVVVHEFGHFATAKAFGIRVNEFGIGFPPRLISIRKGTTLYTLNLIPIGGFVKLEGENEPTNNYSLSSKSAQVRLLVLIAGPFMNIALAVILLAILGMFTANEVHVGGIVFGAPADLSGIKRGDVIREIDGEAIGNFADLRNSITTNIGQESNWVLSRAGREFNVYVVPRHNPPIGEGPTGISVQTVTTYRPWPIHMPWDSGILGIKQTWNIMAAMKAEATGWFSGRTVPELAGPIGIAHMTGQLTKEAGMISLVPLAAVFSLSLGIFNLLPIPALDGGRIMFVVIEWVRRGKKVPPEKEGIIHLMGFIFLIGIIMLVTYNDIIKIVEGNSILR